MIVLGSIGAVQCATNEPPLLPPTKLQSVEAVKPIQTNSVAPWFREGTFEEGVIFGALAFARNPDVRDPKVIVEIARGLWQAQKRADAQRQTNALGK